MTDNDLIRRGDVKEIIEDCGTMERSLQRLSALPAASIQPMIDAAVAKALEQAAVVAFTHATSSAPANERKKIAAAIRALRPATQPHVNETPKSEHDAGNVLTAGAIRKDSPNHAYRVGYAAGRAAALREAAAVAHDHTPEKHGGATLASHVTGRNIEAAILALLTEKPHDRA